MSDQGCMTPIERLLEETVKAVCDSNGHKHWAGGLRRVATHAAAEIRRLREKNDDLEAAAEHWQQMTRNRSDRLMEVAVKLTQAKEENERLKAAEKRAWGTINRTERADNQFLRSSERRLSEELAAAQRENERLKQNICAICYHRMDDNKADETNTKGE